MEQNRESGYMLVGVLLAITILAVVGTSLVILTTNSVKTSSAERDNQAVYYIAEAGLNHKLKQIETEIEEKAAKIYEQVKGQSDEDEKFYEKIESFFNEDSLYDEFEPGLKGEEVKAETYIERAPVEEGEPINGRYIVTSTGFIGDEARAVQTSFEVDWQAGEERQEGGTGQGLPKFAIFTKGDIDVIPSLYIQGLLGTAHTQIKKPSTEVHGGAGFVTESKESFPELPEFRRKENLSLISDSDNDGNLKINGTNNYLKIQDNSRIETLIIKKNQVLKLEIDGKIDFKVSNLIMEKNSSIELITKNNKDEIYFHIDNQASFNNNTINIDGNSSQFYLFYGGADTLKLNKINMKGSVYLLKSKLDIQQSHLDGNIFSGGDYIFFDSSATLKTPLILAPNAELSLKGTLHLHGMLMVNTIIANDLWGNNGTVAIEYQDCSNPTYDDHLTKHCPDPNIEGPISLKAVEEFNSGGSSDGDGGVEGTNASFDFMKPGKIKEVEPIIN